MADVFDNMSDATGLAPVGDPAAPPESVADDDVFSRMGQMRRDEANGNVMASMDADPVKAAAAADLAK